jgi:hypothetical protein
MSCPTQAQVSLFRAGPTHACGPSGARTTCWISCPSLWPGGGRKGWWGCRGGGSRWGLEMDHRRRGGGSLHRGLGTSTSAAGRGLHCEQGVLASAVNIDVHLAPNTLACPKARDFGPARMSCPSVGRDPSTPGGMARPVNVVWPVSGPLNPPPHVYCQTLTHLSHSSKPITATSHS